MNTVGVNAGVASLESQRKHLTLLRVLYPIWMICGIFSLMYVPSMLIVQGDVATTISNLSSHSLLFRLGIAGSLFTQLIYIFAVLYLYKLFEVVDKDQSVLMVVFALLAVPIAMLGTVNQMAVLLLNGGSEYLNGFTVDQRNALTMLFIELGRKGNLVASIFWGLWLFPLGYLAYKSNYFPKFIGVALVIAGIGYFVGAFTSLILPNAKMLLEITGYMTIGEVVFIAWLVVLGAKFSP